MLDRRQFLASLSVLAPTADTTPTAFFFIGDTHYLANRDKPKELTTVSRDVTTRLIDWLNRLPGTKIPDAAGGGVVQPVSGVIHAGDCIDTGDKTGMLADNMQQTEWRSFEADFGLTGKDGRLKVPVYEVHGNHDAPSGKGLVIDGIIRRNKKRPGVVNVSENGLHYSWDWGPVHFVNLGIVVGSINKVKRKRRYPALDSLAFLTADLAKHAKDPKKPIILTHHVDVARYSESCDMDAKPKGNPEWDACDVQGYHEAIKDRNVLGVLYGHTHARNIFRWDGTKKKAAKGVPVFNTEKASHFNGKTQALMYFEVNERELLVREFATKDYWQTGAWTALKWQVSRS